MIGPDRIWAERKTMPGDPADNGYWESRNLYALTMAEYIRRDPAVLAALPEVQALIAAAYEAAAAMIEDNVRHAKELGREIWPIPDLRTVTSHDATAALARIEREAEARGRVKGLREAAEIAGLNAWKHAGDDNYSRGMDAGAIHQVKACCDAILARAAKIEADALIEVYYQREMASDEPQGPHDLSIGGE